MQNSSARQSGKSIAILLAALKMLKPGQNLLYGNGDGQYIITKTDKISGQNYSSVVLNERAIEANIIMNEAHFEEN